MRQAILIATVISAYSMTHSVWAGVSPTGAFTESYSIDLPAYHGLEPTIRLSYSSAGGNGLLGVGWRLNAGSTITRVSEAKGAARFDSTDKYLLDGLELVPCSEVAAGASPSCDHPPLEPYCGVGGYPCISYTTRIESYQRIAYWQNDYGASVWLVWSKDGTFHTYEPQGKLGSIGNAGFYRWELSSVTDTSGNRVDYDYFEDTFSGPVPPENGVALRSYLEGIRYGGYTVRFFYESRPDMLSRAVGGGPDADNHGALQKLHLRLGLIDVRANNDRVRVYRLSYTNDGETNRSKLQQIEHFGSDAIVTEGLNYTADISNDDVASKHPATEFFITSVTDPAIMGDFSGSGPEGDPGPSYDVAPYTDASPTQPLAFSTSPLANGVESPLAQTFSVDVNGDGRTELVTARLVFNPGSEWGIHGGNNGGTHYQLQTHFYDDNGTVTSSVTFDDPAHMIAESDLVGSDPYFRNCHCDWGWHGLGWDCAERPLPSMAYNTMYNPNFKRMGFFHSNEDAFADIWSVVQWGCSSDIRVTFYMGNGDGTFEKTITRVYTNPYILNVPESIPGDPNTANPPFPYLVAATGDVDGDDLSDLVIAWADPWHGYPTQISNKIKLFVAFSMGDGTFDTAGTDFLTNPFAPPFGWEAGWDNYEEAQLCVGCGGQTDGLHTNQAQNLPSEAGICVENMPIQICHVKWMHINGFFELNLADVTGDGRQDAVVVANSEPHGTSTNTHVHAWTAESTGIREYWHGDPFVCIGDCSQGAEWDNQTWEQWSILNNGEFGSQFAYYSPCSDWRTFPMDLNDDGLVDFAFMGDDPWDAGSGLDIIVNYSNGDGTYITYTKRPIHGLDYDACGPTVERRWRNNSRFPLYYPQRTRDVYIAPNGEKTVERDTSLSGGGSVSVGTSRATRSGYSVRARSLAGGGGGLFDWADRISRLGQLQSDYDSDGRADLLWVGRQWTSGKTYKILVEPILNQGGGTFARSTEPTGAWPRDTGWEVDYTETPVTNVLPAEVRRGFGPDFAFTAHSAATTSPQPALRYGTGWSSDTGRDTWNWHFVELNGDGHTDLVYFHSDGTIRMLFNDGVNGNTSFASYLFGPGGVSPEMTSGAAVAYADVGVGEAFDVSRWRILDVNADGKLDFVYPDRRTTTGGVRVFSIIATQPGDPEPFRVTYQDVFTAAEIGEGAAAVVNGTQWLPADINGDGRGDLVWIKKEPTLGSVTVFSLIGTTVGAQGQQFGGYVAGASEETVYNSYGDLAEVLGAIQLSTRSGDFDGDGKVDLVFARRVAGGLELDVHVLFSRTPHAATTPVFSQQASYGAVPRAGGDPLLPGMAGWRVTDINGDGLADLLLLQRSTARLGKRDLIAKVLYSTGFGAQWVYEEFWQQPSALDFSGSDGVRLVDFDGDSRPEVAHLTKGVMEVIRSSDLSATPVQTYLPLPGSPQEQAAWTIADIEGNARAQLAYVWFDTATGRTKVHWSSSAMRGEKLDRLTTSAGAQTYVTYQPSVDRLLAPGQQGAAPMVSGFPCMVPGGRAFDVVQRLTTTNGMNPEGPRFQEGYTDYYYKCPIWDFEEHRFFGFYEAIQAHVYPETKLPKRFDHRRFDYTYECGRWLASSGSTEFNAPENVYAQSNTLFNNVGAAPPYDCLPATSQHETCELGADCLLSWRNTQYDFYGNVVKSWKNAAAGGKPRVRTSDYLANTDSWIFKKATDSLYGAFLLGDTVFFVETEDNLRSRTNYCYDDDPAIGLPTDDPMPCEPGNVDDVTLGKGLLRQTRAWTPDSPSGYQLVADMEYDGFGNVTRTTDALGNASTVAYDPSGLFPIETCNALGQCSQTVWDYTLGLPEYAIDANGYWQDYTKYDALGRVQATLERNCNVTRTEYLDWGDPNLQSTKVTTASGTDDQLESRTYYDGLGRTYLVEKSGVGAGGTPSLYKQDTVYDGASQRVKRVSHWYEETAYPLGANDWTTFSYDDLDRLTKTEYANGEMVTADFGVNSTRTWTTTTDEMGHRKMTYRDMFGQVREVVEYNDQAAYTTYYEYDTRGNLISSLDDQGNEITAQWNSLGQKTESNDPDLGTWRYYYDEVGRLSGQVDALGNTIVHEFDAAGRTTITHYNDDPAKDVFYLYDWVPGSSGWNSANSAGRLTAVRDPSCVSGSGYAVRNRYDEMGNIILEERCIDTEVQVIGTSYDQLGRIATLTYPNEEVVTHEYDHAGRLYSVSGYVDSIAYDPGGRVTTMSLSNGVTESYGYDSVNRLTSIEVRDSGGQLFQETYTFSPDGLLDSISSTANGTNRAYGYDDLHRLTEVTEGGSLIQSFSYDSIGNITSNSGLGTYTYEPNRPHAVATAGIHTYDYDANGNMTSRDGAALVIDWNERNLPEEITTASTTMSYVYDHAGSRVSQSDGATTTRYFDPLAETNTAAGTKQYYFANGRRIAQKETGDVVRFYHQDRLGSTRIMTDAATPTPNVVGDYDFEEYGKQLSHNGSESTEIKFTGHREAIGTESADYSPLIFMNARYYDPEIGRFISADSVGPQVTNLQSLNRYSYTFNNPLGYVDPTGLYAIKRDILGLPIEKDVPNCIACPKAYPWWLNQDFGFQLGTYELSHKFESYYEHLLLDLLISSDPVQVKVEIPKTTLTKNDIAWQRELRRLAPLRNLQADFNAWVSGITNVSQNPIAPVLQTFVRVVGKQDIQIQAAFAQLGSTLMAPLDAYASASAGSTAPGPFRYMKNYTQQSRSMPPVVRGGILPASAWQPTGISSILGPSSAEPQGKPPPSLETLYYYELFGSGL